MAKVQNYDALADKILELIGGKDNISFFNHCLTRLRINPKDKSTVKAEEIGKLAGVIGCQWQGEQLQIIIGPDVATLYDVICDKAELKKEKQIDENLDVKRKKEFHFSDLLNGIVGCITPLLPALVAAGLIKVILLILTTASLLSTENNTYVALSFISDAAFYFLPVMVGATGAKRFGASIGTGMLLGAVLIHPTFVSLVSGGTSLSIFGLPITSGSYSSSVFPMVLTMFVCGYVERFIAKHMPKLMRSIFTPLLTVLIMAPLMLVVIAPLGSIVGNVVAKVLMWISGVFGPFGIAIIAALMPFIIMTGMHMALVPNMFEALATAGYDAILIPCFVISNFGQGGACAAVALKTKDVNLKSTGLSAAVSTIVAGISEPAMYGITLKYRRSMYGAMIGSFVGALAAGFLHVSSYAFAGTMGMFALGGFANSGSNLLYAVLACVIATIVSFIATMLLYRPEKAEKE